MTELLRLRINSVTRGAAHEFGMACAVEFPGVDKSACLVVGSLDAGQLRQHRDLVGAVSPATPGTARRSRRHVRHRTDAPALCRLCRWLRLQAIPSARERPADLSGPLVAIERP